MSYNIVLCEKSEFSSQGIWQTRVENTFAEENLEMKDNTYKHHFKCIAEPVKIIHKITRH